MLTGDQQKESTRLDHWIHNSRLSTRQGNASQYRGLGLEEATTESRLVAVMRGAERKHLGRTVDSCSNAGNDAAVQRFQNRHAPVRGEGGSTDGALQEDATRG